MARPWRTCHASDVKRREINARWPARDRSSDGTVGDLAHQSRASDHNPHVVHNGMGIVRADDIDVNGIDAAWYAEHVRLLGSRGDRRLNPGGYVIFNRRIAGSHTGWQWRVYTGSNPHTGHVHTSYSSRIADFDLQHPWGIFGGMPPPPPPPPAGVPAFPLPPGHFYGPLDGPKESVSNLGRTVRPEWRNGLMTWQRRMRDRGWSVDTDGLYGAQTNEVARRFQQEKGLTADGLIGPRTWAMAWTAPVT
jgi:hypothetical protein